MLDNLEGTIEQVVSQEVSLETTVSSTTSVSDTKEYSVALTVSKEFKTLLGGVDVSVEVGYGTSTTITTEETEENTIA